MKDVLNNLKKNKKVLIIAGVVVAIILLVVILFLIFGGNNKNQSQELSSSLKDLGITFYEDFYYNQIGSNDEERREFLEKYKDIGIKVSLDSLSRHKKDETKQILEEFVNEETGEECDKNSSMVVIYPREPYGKKDYSIDAKLICGFEETETK